MNVHARLAYFGAFCLILGAEIYIALCVRGGFVRHYVGDVLAVIALYTLIRAIFGRKIKHLWLKIFLVAAALETAQYLGLTQNLQWNVLKILLGGTFDTVDLLCYAVGCGLIYADERLNSLNLR